MCEFKSKDSEPVSVTILDGSNVVAGIPGPIKKDAAYFETALEATKFGKFNYLIIFISGLILANILLETLGMSYVMAVSQCDLQMSVQERGIISAIGFVGIISSSHLWGFLADTTGRRNIIRPTLLLGFFFTVISSFSTNFWLMVILRYLNGFCISGGSGTIYAYLGEFHTQKNRSRAIMGSAFIFGVGAMLMPAIAWVVINQEWRFAIPFLGIIYKPWRFFMVVCGIPGFLCGLCLFKIPESPKFILSIGDEKKTLEILSTIFHLNTGRPKHEYPIQHVVEDMDVFMSPGTQKNNSSNAIIALLQSMWTQTQPLFNREYLGNTTLICTIQFITFATSNGMYMWFPTMLNNVVEYMNRNPNKRIYICDIMYEYQRLNLNQNVTDTTHDFSDPEYTMDTCNEKLEVSTYQYSLLLELLYAIGFAVIGIIINKVDKQIILFISLVGCGICGVLIIFINNPVAGIYIFVILLLCGLGINVLSATTVDLYPTRLRAMAICISLMMGRLGSVAGANIVGALLTNNCESAFLTSGISLIVAGVLGFFITKVRKLNILNESSRRSSLISMTGN